MPESAPSAVVSVTPQSLAEPPVPPLPVLATIAVPVPYAPNPLTTALLIIENGMSDGPYPCAVSGPAADGITYMLTASLTSLAPGLAPGDALVQAGDVINGVFVAAVIGGVPVPPDSGKLALQGAGTAAQDLDIAAFAPVGDIVRQAGVLWASSDDFLHVLVVATASLDESPVNLAGASIEMAAVRAFPQEGDWQAATWLVRTADPAGTYARLAVGPSGFSLLPGCYWVYVRIMLGGQVFVRRALGTLRVQN